MLKAPILLFAALLSLSLPHALAQTTSDSSTADEEDAQKKPLPKAIPTGYSSIDPIQIQKDLQFISSDKMEGRMSLQPGDKAAIDWIAGEFAKDGLKPLATDAAGKASYLQTFELIEYRPDRASSTITLTRGSAPIVFHAPEAFGAYKAPVDIKAEVVFAGYGITAPELKYDDYAGIDAKGKIVFVFDHEPQEDDPHSIFNGTGNTRYATTRVKLLNAQAHGAVALVVVAEPNRKHLTNAERAAKIGGSITRPVPLPLEALADDELHIPGALIVDKVAVQLLATSGSTGSKLQAAIDKDLTPQSRALPNTTLTLHFRNTEEHKGMTSNVAGLLIGIDKANPAVAQETVILSGHHDHDGVAACAPGQQGIDEEGDTFAADRKCQQIWHGADDNGSGTVGVVELAKAFSSKPGRPLRGILFVVFASEERGLLGSYYMAAHPLRPLATTRAMINFDMIGRDEKPSPQTDGLITIPANTKNRLNLIGALYSPDYNKVVSEENRLVGLDLDDRFDHENALNVLFRSDQFPFLLKNIPAFWWFTGFHPDYHHITDTAEKIDYTKMTKILQLAFLSANRFATDKTVPAFISNPKPN